MFKKILALLLALTVIGAAFVACGTTGDDTNDSGDDANDTPAVTATVTDLKNAVLGAFDGLYDPTNEMGMPLMDIPAESLADMFGVQAEWVEEFAAAMPMMMTNVDTYIIVKPTEGNAENVLNALKDYQDFQVNESMQYPMNIEKVRAAQVFEKGGFVFFIRLGMLSDDALYAEGTEEEISAIQYNEAMANNQKALDAIDALLGK